MSAARTSPRSWSVQTQTCSSSPISVARPYLPLVSIPLRSSRILPTHRCWRRLEAEFNTKYLNYPEAHNPLGLLQRIDNLRSQVLPA